VDERVDPRLRHRQAWDLIPWVVNGRAGLQEQAALQAHLRACADCREEYEFQKRLHDHMNTDAGQAGDAPAALRRLHARIEASMIGSGSSNSRERSRTARLLAAAVVVETIALSALGGARWLQRDTPVAPYHTLSAPEAPTAPASIRAVLSPQMTVAQVQQLLAQAHLQIVAGPTEAGVYSLAPTMPAPTTRTPTTNDRDPAQALQILRSHPGVRFAEPIDAAGAVAQ
jgi:hypothetical protein